MREKLKTELNIYMHILPLSEREALDATQRVNMEPSSENLAKLLETAATYRSHVELINFIIRVLDEVPE